MAPMNQPGAGYRTLEVLLGRIPDLGHRSPFSTQSSEGEDAWDNLLSGGQHGRLAGKLKSGRVKASRAKLSQKKFRRGWRAGPR